MNNAEQHMANERTLLAWIRTGIGIMVFGFVTVKFSLFISQLPTRLLEKNTVPDNSYSVTIGIALVISGALTVLLSYWHYNQTFRQLKKGEYTYSTFLVTLVTVVIFSMSVLLIAYLILASYPHS